MDIDEFLALNDNGYGEDGRYNSDKEQREWTFNFNDSEEKPVVYYLVNTSGSMVKNKSNAKDGEDYKFDVEDYLIKKVVLED